MYTLTTLALTWYFYHVVKIFKLRNQIIKKLESMTEGERHNLKYYAICPSDIKKKYDYDQSYPDSLEEAKRDPLQYVHIYYKHNQKESTFFVGSFIAISLLFAVVLFALAISLLAWIIKYLP